MDDRLAGRVAIVTGGGQGIGRAIVERLIGDGAKVLVATQSVKPGEEVVACAAAAGGTAALSVIDVSRRENCRSLVRDAVDRFGRLDIVVHNAAYIHVGPIAECDDAALDRTFDLNIKAAFWLAADSLPHLTKSAAARLLFVSSISGNRHVHAHYAAYGTSKAALNGFIRQAAIELAPSGIRVNGVEPGVTITERVARGLSPLQIARMNAAIPLGYCSAPQDIAATIAFLASDDAAHVTGQTIIVDGGQSLGQPLPIG